MATELPTSVEIASNGSDKQDPEDSLETHEVVELHAFLERKEWIDEKIKFLESLPPIPVFAGSDDLRSDEVPRGLPTRVQLKEWQTEHERIEKETEVFDSGDLMKLRKLTKAATKKNLSPQDTDLIELTLLTLFALDKLIHLLRDRSDSLELLDLRLIWEEHRANAYKTLRELLDEARAFLRDRGTWSEALYAGGVFRQPGQAPEESIASGTGFSRSARFQAADSLARDAALLSSRIANLRNGPVAAAGRTLDKLVDLSRDEVPEDLLDEQDRLEERCVKDLETVGKFTMAVVDQWRRADDIYVETRKDASALESLKSELGRAMSQQPSRRTEKVFSSRLEVLNRRLTLRRTQTSVFPSPSHELFPEHTSANHTIIEFLSRGVHDSEVSLNTVRVALVKYKIGCDAVEIAERLTAVMTRHIDHLGEFILRFQQGFPSSDGADGSPVDLTSLDCLDPLRHSTYLAMIPSCVEECALCEQSAEESCRESRVAVLHLDAPGVSQQFKDQFLSTITSLEALISSARSTRTEVSFRLVVLRDVRRICSSLDELQVEADSLWVDLTDGLAKAQWKQAFTGEHAPLTPETTSPILLGRAMTPEIMVQNIQDLTGRLTREVSTPLSSLRPSLPRVIGEAVQSRYSGVNIKVQHLQRANVLWERVRQQSEAMLSFREEIHALESRIEEVKLSYDEVFQDVLSGSCSDEEVDGKEAELSRQVVETEAQVQALLSSLPHRVPFVGDTQQNTLDIEDNRIETSALTRLRPSIDPASLDRLVRSDSNAYALRISTSVKALVTQRTFYSFYKNAHAVDVCAQELRGLMTDMEERLRSEMDSVTTLSSSSEPDETLRSLSSTKERVSEGIDPIRSRIAKHISEGREFIDRMRTVPGACDDINNLNILSSRASTLDDLDLRWHRIASKTDTLKSDIGRLEQVCVSRLMEKEHERQLALQAVESSESTRSAAETSVKVPEFDEEEEDVFSSTERDPPSDELQSAITQVRDLRQKLVALAIHNVAWPKINSVQTSTSSLPSMASASSLRSAFTDYRLGAEALRGASEDARFMSEMRSLLHDLDAASVDLLRVECLARFSSCVVACDAAFSDLLDMIDNCPSSRERRRQSTKGLLEEQLSDRIAFVKGLVGDLAEQFAPVSDDLRVSAENQRLQQAWEELMEMALEKLDMEGSSRPGSVSGHSSGRSSRASISTSTPRMTATKRSKYSNLSLGGNERADLLTPPAQRRSVSTASSKLRSSQRGPSLAPSTPKVQALRSVSGPGPMSPPTHSSLHNSTFASRQRTTSLSSTTSSATPLAKKVLPLSHRRPSASLAESVEYARSNSPSVSSASRGTWARAPRQSFGASQRPTTPQDKAKEKQKQKYVANPANKLDVALGDVINKLPVNINVEVVADTWKDMSGKYWIGGTEPKLCFCRILRSQTVMVRVGGGWQELSRFIKDHFADLFRLMPESPPRPGAREEKWISATTLKNETSAPGESVSPSAPGSPKPFIPSFAISSPDGSVTQSVGSPLMPMQFIRRADEPPELALSTPSLATSSRMKVSTPGTPAKPVVWRP